MKIVFTAALLAASTFALPALAGPFDNGNNGSPGTVDYTYPPPLSASAQQQDNTNWAYAQQYRERVINAGGCGADFQTVTLFAYCNRDTFGWPQIGSSGGSSD